MHPNNTTNKPIEEWRDISGYEGTYQVSNLGRIRSIDRIISMRNRHGTSTTQKRPGKVLSPGINTSGYLMVNLVKRGSGNFTTMIHTKVAEAFIGPRPSGCDIHHRNGDKHDNRPENLEYVQEFSHVSDHSRGNLPTNSKLTEDQAREIYRLYHEEGLTSKQIAPMFNVTPSLVLLIKRGERWQRIHST